MSHSLTFNTNTPNDKVVVLENGEIKIDLQVIIAHFEILAKKQKNLGDDIRISAEASLNATIKATSENAESKTEYSDYLKSHAMRFSFADTLATVTDDHYIDVNILKEF
jgi:hypothetical protein